MRIILGALLALIVSGDDETIEGVLEDSVLLPCNCSERDLVFKWQMDEPHPTLVLEHNKTLSVRGSYEGRAKIFLSENSNNCSVLLTNITAGDQGRYRCSFYRRKQYQRFFVNLNVHARYTVCEEPSYNNSNGKSVKCHVIGHYRETEIQWKLDGRLLTNSSTTNITNYPYTLNASTGLYHFQSTLSTKLNATTDLRCEVKAKGITPVISQNCELMPEFIRVSPGCVVRYSKIIPIMFGLLGFSFVLWRRWKFSQRS